MTDWRRRLLALALFWPANAGAQAPSPSEALTLEQKGDLEHAARVWQAVTEQNPRDAGAFASLGVILSKEQKYPEAASAYKKALALNPNNKQARTLLGLSYYGTKRFAEASKHLELAANSDPANTELRQVLAQSCLWAKKYSCALDQFRQILEQSPDSAAAHVLTGEALDGLGRTPEAIVEFQAAAKAAPAEANVNFGLGYLYWKLLQYDDAKPAFERAVTLLKRAVQLKDDLRIAYADLGAIYREQKHYKDALASLQRAVKLDPAQPDTHFQLGRLYQAMGNTTAAQQEFSRVRELHKKADDDLLEKMSGSPPPIQP